MTWQWLESHENEGMCESPSLLHSRDVCLYPYRIWRLKPSLLLIEFTTIFLYPSRFMRLSLVLPDLSLSLGTIRWYVKSRDWSPSGRERGWLSNLRSKQDETRQWHEEDKTHFYVVLIEGKEMGNAHDKGDETWVTFGERKKEWLKLFATSLSFVSFSCPPLSLPKLGQTMRTDVWSYRSRNSCFSSRFELKHMRKREICGWVRRITVVFSLPDICVSLSSPDTRLTISHRSPVSGRRSKTRRWEVYSVQCTVYD